MSNVQEALRDDGNGIVAWFKELEDRLNASVPAARHFQCEVNQSADKKSFTVSVVRWTHGIIANEQSIPDEFFNSHDYERIIALGRQLDGLIGDGAFVQRGDRREMVNSFKQALAWLLEEAKRGQHIQRYKGLGEMNPDQLWETTMNPNTRRLLQVQIEDAVGSDEIFTTLMGDQVEPRRDFIEQNALAVSNLDI
jgi:DNA gyrase subunit B